MSYRQTPFISLYSPWASLLPSVRDYQIKCHAYSNISAHADDRVGPSSQVNLQVLRRASVSQISGVVWVAKSDHKFVHWKNRLRVLSQGHESDNSVKTGER